MLNLSHPSFGTQLYCLVYANSTRVYLHMNMIWGSHFVIYKNFSDFKTKCKDIYQISSNNNVKGINNEHTFAFVCCFIQNSFRRYNFPISEIFFKKGKKQKLCSWNSSTNNTTATLLCNLALVKMYLTFNLYISGHYQPEQKYYPDFCCSNQRANPGLPHYVTLASCKRQDMVSIICFLLKESR